MPCLKIKTNQPLNEQEKAECCLSVSKKVSELLKKPESYVMVMLDDQVTMVMSGNSRPSAYLELKSINLPENETAILSNQLCLHIRKLLSIDSNRIYIEFSNAQRHLWGWDGKTF
jgi:phenylpyruvate tautomerase